MNKNRKYTLTGLAIKLALTWLLIHFDLLRTGMLCRDGKILGFFLTYMMVLLVTRTAATAEGLLTFLLCGFFMWSVVQGLSHWGVPFLNSIGMNGKVCLTCLTGAFCAWDLIHCLGGSRY